MDEPITDNRNFGGGWVGGDGDNDGADGEGPRDGAADEQQHTASPTKHGRDDRSSRIDERRVRFASDGSDRSPGGSLDASSSSCDNEPPGAGGTRGDETKERPNHRGSDNSVGAVQVDEQAPQLNRLFFRRGRGLSSRRRARRAARRREGKDEGGEAEQRCQGATGAAAEKNEVPNATVTPRGGTGESGFFGRSFISIRAPRGQLIEATLVEDVEEGEVVEAEPIGYMERKWKVFASAAGAFLLVILGIAISVFYASRSKEGEEEVAATLSPTIAPTFDPRPTLAIVQERGQLRCGLFNETISSGGFYLELCRSVAAVVLGNPDSIVGVPATFSSRWKLLLDRTVDLVLLGDTYNIERETRESSTGSGFAFSTPYTYDGMIFAGNETLVRCAEEFKRDSECSSLKICVESDTTYLKFMETVFPPDYFTTGSSLGDVTEMLLDGVCNVIASEKTYLQGVSLLKDAVHDGTFVMGKKLMTKEPHAAVSRNTDREFSDIVNWVVQALVFGEVQGLSKNMTRCQNYTDMILGDASELNYMNGVFCVGNYAEIIEGDVNSRGINGINNGTGMLYAIPFGNVDKEELAIEEPDADSMLMRIRKRASLSCGVVVPDNFAGDVTQADKLVGMSVEYCRVLSAAIFIGDEDKVDFLTFAKTDNSSAVALANGTLDVLVGGRNEWKLDFAASPWLEGLHFSTPYYYGNESAIDGASFYSMTTRDDDTLFASFVNCMVLATIHAQENDIKREKSREMPLIHVFGRHFSWALRDAISYSGSYDEVYAKHFGNEVTGRHRNFLNKGGPLMLPFLRFPTQ